MPKLVVIRGVRPAEALFYDAFREFKVRFIYLSQDPQSYPIETKNLELVNLRFRPKYFFDPIAIFRGGKFSNRSWVEIEGLEKHLADVDVVNITDTFYTWSGQAAEIAKNLGKKLVTVVWQTIPHHPSTFIPPYSWNLKKASSSTDLFILRSKLAKGYVRSLGVPDEKIRVIYKGIDLGFFKPRNSKFEIRNSKLRILYVGVLEKHKGILELLGAFARLSREYDNLELWMAGEGPLESYVEEQAKTYPIRYLGFVEYPRLPEVYRNADIFCSPSKDLKYFGIKVWEEYFSYTLMEAQASGLPIAATRCGGIPEEVGGDNLLVDQGDARGLYQALKELVMNKELRIKIGRENRKRAEELFDLKKQARETEKAILSIL